jgi:hypothetical protein
MAKRKINETFLDGVDFIKKAGCVIKAKDDILFALQKEYRITRFSLFESKYSNVFDILFVVAFHFNWYEFKLKKQIKKAIKDIVNRTAVNVGIRFTKSMI